MCRTTLKYFFPWTEIMRYFFDILPRICEKTIIFLFFFFFNIIKIIIPKISCMEILILLYIFIFWLLFGSFSSVIISRLRHKKQGIVSGRSECPKCHHILWAKDLIPVFSFLSTWGKCRYCKAKIPYFYPILEFIFWLSFVATAIFFIDISLLLSGNWAEIVKWIFFLLFTFGTLLYVIYDILYFEIPESVLAWLIWMSFWALLLQNFWMIEFFPHLQNIFSLWIWENIWLIGLFVWSLIWYYLIMLKWLSYKADFWILAILILGAVWLWQLWIPLHETIFWSAFLGSFVVFLFLFLQIVLSNGRAMGWGDLRIAILMGMILGISLSFWWILVTYIAGSIIWIFVIIYTKTRAYYLSKKKILNQVRKILWMREQSVSVDTHIPFWPFLAIGIYAVLLYGNEISQIFQNYL